MKNLTQLINQFPAPAQLWDAAGNVLVSNERFNELLGLPALFDWQKHDVCLARDPQAAASGVDAMIQRALDGALIEIHSFSYDPGLLPFAREGEHELLTLFLTLVPLLDDDGSTACVVCLVAESAASTARLEHELMRSQKMENVERLAGGVAHEFNNIFTGIKGMTELIKDEVEQSSEIYEFADTIQQNITRGAELIQQLSTFARDMPMVLRRKLVSAYLERALPLLQMHVQKRVKIEVELRQDAEVQLDANRLDQALANVMLNARDAMGGQGTIRITVDRQAPEAEADGELPAGVEWCLIEVADSGPGIPPEVHQRVLEPFYTTKERGKATGLGLSVTSRIVLSHNGLVQIGRSAELGGAAIRIFLPLAPPAD